jgi:hypothetical protein
MTDRFNGNNELLLRKGQGNDTVVLMKIDWKHASEQGIDFIGTAQHDAAGIVKLAAGWVV